MRSKKFYCMKCRIIFDYDRKANLSAHCPKCKSGKDTISKSLMDEKPLKALLINDNGERKLIVVALSKKQQAEIATIKKGCKLDIDIKIR